MTRWSGVPQGYSGKFGLLICGKVGMVQLGRGGLR